jgi:hypothetical protein
VRKFIFCVLIILNLANSADADSNSNTAASVAKDRLPLFVTTLAYLPSIMISAKPRMQLNQEQSWLYWHVLVTAIQNLEFTQEEYLSPGKYKNFQIVPSRDANLFIVSPGEAPRSAVTWPDLKAPIMINQDIVNNPANVLTIPDVVQLLIHEVGKKIPGLASNTHAIQVLDSLAATVAKTIAQDYMTIELASGEVLHIQNAPSDEKFSHIGMNAQVSEYGDEYIHLKEVQMRFGREVLMFHENKNGFAFVPTLQSILMEDIKSFKKINKGAALLLTSTNIQQIVVDRNVTDRPLIRFLMNVRERAYRIATKKKDSSDPKDWIFRSFSSTNSGKIVANEGDETLEKTIEVAMRLNPDGTVHVSRRQALESDPTITISDQKKTESDDTITGSMTIKIPANLKNILNNDLRVYLHVRMAEGVARVEVNRMEQQGDRLLIQYRLPSSKTTSQSYMVEEVLLKNKETEILTDLPESILVSSISTKPSEMSVVKLEHLANDQWNDMNLSTTSGPGLAGSPLEKVAQAPGLTHVQPGAQKFRMHFKSKSPLNEIYFYVRKNYITHDPFIHASVHDPIQGLGFIGHAIMQGNPELAYQSAVFTQLIDDVVHISSSEMRQNLVGDDLTVEFSLPMDVMADKGATTYDGGVRYFAKIIAVNQQLDRWRMIDVKSPLFGIDATHYGAKSCQDYFTQKSGN